VLLRRARPYLFVICLAFALAGGGGVSPAAAGSAPPCRYDDILTGHRAYADWDASVLDTMLMLPRSYVPPRLVSTARAGLNPGGYVRSFVIPDLAAMAHAARKAGAGLRVVSSFRDYDHQQEVYDDLVDSYGERAARLVAARPGHSEHQLGTTIDFGSAKVAWGYSDWATTPAGAWMKANAWKYGWVMSYPRGTRAVTCYRYEPWHYRYVGRATAAKIQASGLTLREYLWAHAD
jgi:D-alanyl-D-alanine carboxypeptidase